MPTVWSSPLAAAVPRKFFINSPYQVGKYTISPQAMPDAQGRYRASLSIRSGLGSQRCDRVMRFIPTFDSREDAERFVQIQADAWLAERFVSAPAVA